MDKKTKREYARISMAIKRNKVKGLDYKNLITLRDKLLIKEECVKDSVIKEDFNFLKQMRKVLFPNYSSKIYTEEKDDYSNNVNKNLNIEINNILNNIIIKQDKLESILTESYLDISQKINNLLEQLKVNNNNITKTNNHLTIKKTTLKTKKKLNVITNKEKKSERIRSRKFDQDLITRIEKIKGPGSFTNAIITALDYYRNNNLNYHSFPIHQIKERTVKNKDFKVYPRTREIFESIPEEKRLDVISNLIEKILTESLDN